MDTLRIVMMPLGILHLALVGIVALVGSFADGGDFWSRLVITIIQPAAALALLALVFVRELPKALATLFASILAISIIADLGFAIMIATGNIKGDWPLPLVFAVVPAIALFYTAFLRHIKRPTTFDTTISMHQIG